jgi:hypothetical protein
LTNLFEKLYIYKTSIAVFAMLIGKYLLRIAKDTVVLEKQKRLE